MKLAIPKESAAGETRVAATPETVRRLTRLKLDVAVEAGAGEAAGVRDAEFEAAGATIVADADALLRDADIVLKVDRPMPPPGGGPDEVNRLRRGAVLVSILRPTLHPEQVRKLADAGVTAFAMDLMPRITRAQSMDVLSSQSTLAGYKAVLMAAEAIPKLMPMLMTAAGTIQPANVLVIGAGVAGLQAIATARRLGAVVTGTDTRPVVEEQVRSLGAKFFSMEVQAEAAQGAGGYAKDLGETFYQRQQEQLAPHVKDADIVVTTALIPGRKAPVLITEAMVQSMRRGSVIVDLAAEMGGNCAVTRAGERVEAHGVTVIGPVNLPAAVAVHASQMYARNVATFVAELVKDGQVRLDLENEVLRDTLVTHEGKIVHAASRKAAGVAEAPAGEPAVSQEPAPPPSPQAAAPPRVPPDQQFPDDEPPGPLPLEGEEDATAPETARGEPGGRKPPSQT